MLVNVKEEPMDGLQSEPECRLIRLIKPEITEYRDLKHENVEVCNVDQNKIQCFLDSLCFITF
jgi:hypothetical protein